MAQIIRNKESTIIRLSLNVLQLEEARGHLKWKVQELAKRSKLSRSLIYKYLGSNKKEILIAALRCFIYDFYGIYEKSPSSSFSQQIQEARKKILQYPEAAIFYQKWRARPSWLRDEFIKIEEHFHAKLKKRFPHFSSAEVLALHALIHGLVSAPFLSAEESGQIFKFYWSAVFKR